MKIRIVSDKEMEDDINMLPDDIEALTEKTVIVGAPEEADGALFREKSKNVDEIVIPQSIYDDMIAKGLNPDEIIAMLIGAMGKQN